MNVGKILMFVGVISLVMTQRPVYCQETGAPKDIKSEQSLPDGIPMS